MKTVIIHPDYNSATKANDISIVKLKTPLTFNENVKGACLPESSFAPQSLAVVSGWGTTVSGMYFITNSCGQVVRDFEREAKTRCNF